MAESTDSLKQDTIEKNDNNPDAVREALLKLRRLAAGLPVIDAAEVVRDIRDAGSHTS